MRGVSSGICVHQARTPWVDDKRMWYVQRSMEGWTKGLKRQANKNNKRSRKKKENWLGSKNLIVPAAFCARWSSCEHCAYIFHLLSKCSWWLAPTLDTEIDVRVYFSQTDLRVRDFQGSSIECSTKFSGSLCYNIYSICAASAFVIIG